MQNIRPCPYCGGEVEVIKLPPRKTEHGSVYRIECRSCRALVARGKKFPDESDYAGKLRIRQYKAAIEEFLRRV